MKGATVILFHGALLLLVYDSLLALASQQVNEGNYIVPRATLQLSSNSNRTAEGHKKRCTTNLDCEEYLNNQCCPTISGYSKCRKKCRPKTKYRGVPKTGRSRHRNRRGKKKHPTSKTLVGCLDGRRRYKENEVIQAKDGCNHCKCKEGKMICTEKHCRPGKCPYNNELFDEGYLLLLHNGCKKCICRYSSWNCTAQPCKEGDKLATKQQNYAMSIFPSVVLGLVCLAMNSLMLT